MSSFNQSITPSISISSLQSQDAELNNNDSSGYRDCPVTLSALNPQPISAASEDFGGDLLTFRCLQVSSASTFDVLASRVDRPYEPAFLHSSASKTKASSSSSSTFSPADVFPGILPSFTIEGVTRQPPLVPARLLPNHCTSLKSADELASLISIYFTGVSSLRVEFLPFQFCWRCDYSEGQGEDECFSCMEVKIYRHPKRSPKFGEHVVEWQLVYGDRSVFFDLVSGCRNAIANEQYSSASLLATPSSSSSSSSSSKQGLLAVLDDCSAGVLELLPAMQEISTLFFDTSVPSEVDVQIFNRLCTLASRRSGDKSDVVLQHAVVALADMLASDPAGGATFLASVELAHMRTISSESNYDNAFVASKCEMISKLVAV